MYTCSNCMWKNRYQGSGSNIVVLVRYTSAASKKKKCAFDIDFLKNHFKSNERWKYSTFLEYLRCIRYSGLSICRLTSSVIALEKGNIRWHWESRRLRKAGS